LLISGILPKKPHIKQGNIPYEVQENQIYLIYFYSSSNLSSFSVDNLSNRVTKWQILTEIKNKKACMKQAF
jgi:hypothetical protein